MEIQIPYYHLHFHLFPLSHTQILKFQKTLQTLTPRTSQVTFHRKPPPTYRITPPSPPQRPRKSVWTVDASSTRIYLQSGLVFSPYGSYWRLLRKVCTLELFSMKRIQSFRKIREEEVSEVVKFIDKHEGSTVNLSKLISPLKNSIVARAAFGKKTKNVEQILSTVEYAVQVPSGLTICDLYPSFKFLKAISWTRYKLAKAHREVDRLLGNIIDDHKAKKEIGDDGKAHEDLVDVLLRVQKQNINDEVTLTLDNLKAVIMNVFVAGTETAATTLEWAISELMNHPEAMKEARAEVRKVYGSKGYVDESELDQLKYVEAVIKETLGLHPPGL